MQTENLTYRNNGTGLEKVIEIDTTPPPPAPSGFSWAFDPPTPLEIPIPSVGGMDIFWNHTIYIPQCHNLE